MAIRAFKHSYESIQPPPNVVLEDAALSTHEKLQATRAHYLETRKTLLIVPLLTKQSKFTAEEYIIVSSRNTMASLLLLSE